MINSLLINYSWMNSEFYHYFYEFNKELKGEAKNIVRKCDWLCIYTIWNKRDNFLFLLHLSPPSPTQEQDPSKLLDMLKILMTQKSNLKVNRISFSFILQRDNSKIFDSFKIRST